MESTNAMLEFLVENNIGDKINNQYWNNMITHGFDDYDYFLKMSEPDVKEMCELCAITKFVHVKKVLTGWKLLTMKASDINLVCESVESRVVSMPAAENSYLFCKI